MQFAFSFFIQYYKSIKFGEIRWDSRPVQQLELFFKLVSLRKFEITADRNCSKTDGPFSLSGKACFAALGRDYC